MKRSFGYLRSDPLGEPLRTHSCTKDEELNDIACQSRDNMCAQNRHQVRQDLGERRLDKHSGLPDILGSLMSGAREMMKEEAR